MGQRWKKPDDWFVFQTSLSYQHFDLNDFGSFFSFTNGRANNLALTAVLGRNSVSDPIFPVWGSNVQVSVKATPPYSAFRGDDFYVNEDGDRPGKREACEKHGVEYIVAARTPEEGLEARSSTDIKASLAASRR